MNTNHGTQKSAIGPAKSLEDSPSHRNRMMVSIAVALGLVLIAVAVGLVLSSCGSNSDQTSSVQTESPVDQVVTASVIGDPESAGSTSGALEPAATPAPDLDATVTQSIVLPGDSVEVVARATTDAVSVSLWDGYQERQALTYDESTNLWRGSYRVPMRASWDRLGLSVTARNANQRWSRVWVFLNMREEETREMEETPGMEVDSTSGH